MLSKILLTTLILSMLALILIIGSIIGFFVLIILLKNDTDTLVFFDGTIGHSVTFDFNLLLTKSYNI
jgi:hypothetical protein